MTGLGIAVEDDLIWTDVWRADPNEEVHANMWAFMGALGRLYARHGTFDLVVVETVSVQWNLNTVRRIAYFEACAMIKGAAEGSEVIRVQATRARRIVLGKGSLSKEACYDRLNMDERFRGFWPGPAAPKAKGGMDETDAGVLALAGPALLEGRKPT